MSNANQLATAISEAADLIEKYNPMLAACFRLQPFRRVDLALAFAAGFKPNEYGDIPRICRLILEVAYADRSTRAALVGR